MTKAKNKNNLATKSWIKKIISSFLLWRKLVVAGKSDGTDAFLSQIIDEAREARVEAGFYSDYFVAHRLGHFLDKLLTWYDALELDQDLDYKFRQRIVLFNSLKLEAQSLEEQLHDVP